MVEELLAILDRPATDTATRVVVLTGAGRAFTNR
jgi:enoyl-CoA hydratase/carnithine racemase